jgi:hypothetical protein
VFNLRWSGLAAVVAFLVSLILGISVHAQIHIVLLRAFGFALAFFFLAALLWRLINRYLPELLQIPSPQDSPLMPDLETGSRVDITLGDSEIPRNAAIPPEGASDESVGNIADMTRSRTRERSEPPPDPSPDPSPSPSPAPSFVPLSAQGMDQSPPSRYTQEREGVPAAPPPNPGSKGGVSGVSALGDLSGDVESLPDLDALAGTFLSSGAAGDEEASAPSSTGVGEYRSKKGKEVGEDFNPKELASAIQTILKRD